MKKKITAIVIIICLCVTGFTISVQADRNPTRDEAISWLYNQKGVWYDLDGKYGAQCSDFASAYMNWLYSGEVNPYQGYVVYSASYYPTVAGWNTDRWAVYQNTSSFTPEPGDIYVQSAHIGVFLTGSKSNATVIDQNSWESWDLANKYGGNGRECRIYNTSVSDANYFIRYKNFSTEVSVNFSDWTNEKYTYIRDTDAAIGMNITASGGSISTIGMKLYNSSQNEIASVSQSYTLPQNYFKINEELKVTLTPGTKYYYKFFATVGGNTYYSDMKEFTTTGTSKVSVSKITLNKTNAEAATKTNVQLIAAVAPLDAADRSITWSSSDTNVATVDQNGLVSVLRYGTATITATANDGSGVKATCTIQGRFYDVNGSATKVASNYQYYYNPVYWAAENGITKGYDGVYFGPDKNCTRCELLIFLWRMAGKPLGFDYVNPHNVFNDMGKYSSSSAAYKAVAWGISNGIVKGFSDGSFRPDESVTRLQAMVMIYRAAGKPEWSTSRGEMAFADVKGVYKTSSDSYNAICWAYNNRITNGYSSGTYAGQFGCGLNCLRKEIVTFLYRYNNL